MRDLPLLKRRSRLYDALEELRGIAAIKHLEAHGSDVFAQTLELGLEEIVAKRADSQYRAGLHRAWLKIKNPNHYRKAALSFGSP